MATLDKSAVEVESIKQQLDLKQEEKYEIKSNISSMQATIEANTKQIEEKQKLLDKNISEKDMLSINKNEIYNELNTKQQGLKEVNESLNLEQEKVSNLSKEKENIEVEKSKLNQDIMTLKSKYNYLKNNPSL